MLFGRGSTIVIVVPGACRLKGEVVLSSSCSKHAVWKGRYGHRQTVLLLFNSVERQQTPRYPVDFFLLGGSGGGEETWACCRAAAYVNIVEHAVRSLDSWILFSRSREGDGV